ncbi:hypothetical protein J437_LFUL012825 [Ladona fulva]|uniref:Uncharacterized protein n=1 Tax=Ladona fulva TaxID=123851 RepID=A0A8K0P587_LADFU|nr:hypothetical protein J437_LFUL012825 [Ladona fulva]
MPRSPFHVWSFKEDMTVEATEKYIKDKLPGKYVEIEQLKVLGLNMEGMSSSKIGNKKVLHSQAREIINRVLAYMKKKAVEGISIPLRSVHERVVAATGVSKHTLKRISKEGKDICDGLSQSFMSPRKSKPQRCSISTVDDFDVQPWMRFRV